MLRTGPPTIDRDQRRKAFGEDGARTAAIGTAKAADTEAQNDATAGHREVGHATEVATLDTSGARRTQRTAGGAPARSEREHQRVLIDLDLFQVQASEVGEEGKERHRGVLRKVLRMRIFQIPPLPRQRK